MGVFFVSEEKKNDKIELIDIIKDISIIGGILIVINAYFRWGSNKDTLIDESLISLLAFGLLILTAIMQNYDLNLQREELKATRLELKESADAQKEQKIEMDKSNKLVLRNLKQSQFFELMRLREELIKGLEVVSFTKINNMFLNRISYEIDEVVQKDELLMKTLTKHRTIFVNLDVKSLEMLKENEVDAYNCLNVIFREKYKDTLDNYVTLEYAKIVQINNIINLMLEQKHVVGRYQTSLAKILSNSIDQKMINTLRENFGYTKKELKLLDIDKMMKIKDEDKFYIIMGGDLTLEKFIEYIQRV